MEHAVSFQLFGSRGFVNPTHRLIAGRLSTLFFDYKTQTFRHKQGESFDGAWRWFQSHEGSYLVLYNLRLHRRAHVTITDMEITEAWSPEYLLLCKQVEVIQDSNYFQAQEQVQDAIATMIFTARQELGLR